MNAPLLSSPSSAWTWPLVLGISSVFGLVTALIVEGQISWDLLCWALLSMPALVVIRALWRGRKSR